MNLLIGQLWHVILVFPLSCCSSRHILLHLSQILMKLTFSLCIWGKSAQQTFARERPVPMHWEDQFLPLCRQMATQTTASCPRSLQAIKSISILQPWVAYLDPLNNLVICNHNTETISANAAKNIFCWE